VLESMVQSYPGNLSINEREMFESSVKTIIRTKQENLNKISKLIKEVKKQEAEEDPQDEQEKEIKKENNFIILDSLTEEKNYIENQIKLICKKTLTLIDNQLLKNSNCNENDVFLLRMKGEMYKYLSQVEKKEEYDLLNTAKNFLKQSLEKAHQKLDILSTTYLDTILANVKFIRDFLNNPEAANNIIKSVMKLDKVRLILDKMIEIDDKVYSLLEQIKNMQK
jgi:14-3-3 protein beta/theta/zeta